VWLQHWAVSCLSQRQQAVQLVIIGLRGHEAAAVVLRAQERCTKQKQTRRGWAGDCLRESGPTLLCWLPALDAGTEAGGSQQGRRTAHAGCVNAALYELVLQQSTNDLSWGQHSTWWQAASGGRRVAGGE
jgi:hypothetical protein